MIDEDGFHVPDDVPSIGDPPYVHGDHAATCVGPYGYGCEECNPSDVTPCGHDHMDGVDSKDLADPAKVWRCVACGAEQTNDPGR